MTALLDRAIEAARSLSPEAQDDIACVLLQLVGADGEPVPLTAVEAAAVAASTAAAQGEFATEEEVRAAWAKYGL
ncbi:MAG TPA: hypothetical protein VG651_04890 [Stellaceae bacterium]|nr:hypothetical protein [Stellaceae bacterium]